MAYTRIHAIKTTLIKALNYIENPDKTDEELLISGYNVDPQFAATEYEMTAALAREIKGDYTKTGGGNNLAYHMIQSFAPFDKVTAVQAHEIGKKWADEILGGKYEYVISTHVDKGHIHNHIIFNATSFYDYKKFETAPYKTAKHLREVSDKLCEEQGLFVIKEPKGKGKSHKEWEHRKSGTSWKAKIENIIDKAILQANNYEMFTQLLSDFGVEIKEGKHIAFTLKSEGQEKYTRGKSIGSEYTREAILKRISDPNKNMNKSVPDEKSHNETLSKTAPEKRIEVFSSYDKKIEYMSRQTRLANTKELANALLTIRKENINKYSDFDIRVAALHEKAVDVKGVVKTLDGKNAQYKEVAKYLLAVNKYLPVKQGLEKQSFIGKKGYEKKYESELLAYNHAVSMLEKLGVNTNVDPEKVIALIKDQDGKVSELTSAFREVESRINNIRQSQKIVDTIISDDMDKGKERSRGNNI